MFCSDMAILDKFKITSSILGFIVFNSEIIWWRKKLRAYFVLKLLESLLGTSLLMLFPALSKNKNEMHKKNGLSYLGLYAVYLIILFLI